jgi:hypothetical protein
MNVFAALMNTRNDVGVLALAAMRRAIALRFYVRESLM